ncbi:MAG TPA: hypothetical protein VFM98_04865 [Ramlibacter sp.]|uniref:hypothetical protein n=1 Tax=Ramlibacter sp. TaxID=1917967 RepID=UPI002D7FBC46|nr:hypothetical protein [Ramlibacter sp.]HET8744910.1 hypothetical protein [Ramlibacter sp.]
MNTQPLTMGPVQRELLREFERLHEEWRMAVAAADAIECTGLDGERQEEVQRLLEYRLAADRLHQAAMQLLRDRPL